MIRRFFRVPLPKILLFLEAVVSIIILSNLWSVAEKYYRTSLSQSNGSKYLYDVSFDVYVSRITYGTYDEYVENRETTKKQIAEFLEDLCSLGGNVSACPIGGNIGDGDRVVYTVYFSATEPIRTPMESSQYAFNEMSGIYLGNYHVNYMDTKQQVKVFQDYLDVIGIMTTYAFEKNTDIYVKYNDLSDLSKASVVDYFYTANDLPITIRAESDSVSEEEFKNALSESVKKYSMISVQEYDQSMAVEYDAYTKMFPVIKYGFCGLGVLLCMGVIIQTMALLLYENRINLLIKKTFGMSEFQIFFPEYGKTLVILFAAALTAGVLEIAIYCFWIRYQLQSVIISMAGAVAGIILLSSLTFFISFLRFRTKRKTLAAELTGEEE